jgi:peptidoglycan/LPS O-acetylase OafA/YrhL
MVGVLLAWCTRRFTIDVRLAGLVAGIGAGALFVAVLVLGRLAVMASPWCYLLTSAASTGAVVLATSPSWLSVQLAESRALQWLGTRAYGVYLAHYGLIRGMEGLGWPAGDKGAATLIGAAMTLLLAELLWRTIEAPMIAVGKKMSVMSPADLKLSLRRLRRVA